jgi:hypothetical protein
LVGLLTLGSCSPTSKQTTPAQITSTNIKQAPYLLLPRPVKQTTPLLLKERSPVSPEIEAQLREKYGSTLVSMYDDPVFQNYLARKRGEKPTPLSLMPPGSFHTLAHDYATSVTGCMGSNTFDGYAFYRSVGCYYGEEHLGGDWNWPDSCYQSGGTPYYHVTEHCSLAGDPPCSYTTYSIEPEICYHNGDGSGESGSADPSQCPEGTAPTGYNESGGIVCEAFASGSDFDLFMVHGNHPGSNRTLPPEDNPQSQVTLSPGDANDAFDYTIPAIFDRKEKGWHFEVLKANGKVIYTEEGLGNGKAAWDGSDQDPPLQNGFYTARLTQLEDPSIVLERKIKIDNKAPVISHIRVEENTRYDLVIIRANIREASQGDFQSGINPQMNKIYFDYNVNNDNISQSFDPGSGELIMDFPGVQAYRTAQQSSQQQNGYDFPFELRSADFAGNEVSNRVTGNDGPLRIQVPDPYFSPNGDGVKDSLAFNVIAETSEAYTVQIKRNGAEVKRWSGLAGNQSLSWDGLQNGLHLADGSYRIVVSTDKQRDRVRDAQKVVLDNTPPEIDEPELVTRKDGREELKFEIRDPGTNGAASGINPEDIQIEFAQDSGFAQDSSPVKNANQAGTKITLFAALNELPFQTSSVSSGFKIQVLGDGSPPLIARPKGKISAPDSAGNKTQIRFGDGNICLHKSSVNEMRQNYSKALKELDKLILEISPFKRGGPLISDFSIQAVVKCETGECDTPNLAAALVDHYRNLETRETVEFNGFRAQVLLQREKDEIYLNAIALSAVEGALLFAIPVGAEIGMAAEMHAFMQAWKGLSPMATAYILNKNFSALIDILTTFRNYSARAVEVLNKAIGKEGFCVPAQTLGNARQFEKGMVNFSDDIKFSIGNQADDMLLIDEATGRINNPKSLVEKELKPYYIKDSSGQVIGSVSVPKISNEKNVPFPQEIITGIKLAKDGFATIVKEKYLQEPDLLLRGYSSNAEIPYQIWDLKSSKDANSINNAFHKMLNSAKDNFSYFIERDIPKRLVIDVGEKYTQSEVNTYINMLKGNPPPILSKDRNAAFYFNKLDELIIFTIDGKLLLNK